MSPGREVELKLEVPAHSLNRPGFTEARLRGWACWLRRSAAHISGKTAKNANGLLPAVCSISALLQNLDRIELRNVVAKYPFGRSRISPGTQANSGHRDYSVFAGRRGRPSCVSPMPQPKREWSLVARFGRTNGSYHDISNT